MKLFLIRHGMTKGNLEKRYVGRTDEELTFDCAAALLRIVEGGKIPAFCRGERLRALYMSPMKRCRRTAELLFPPELYPGIRREAVNDLRECDFGLFEMKNYQELSGDPAYRHFIDTMGVDGFPGGESSEDFKIRCVRAFGEILQRELEAEDEGTLVFVVHGGTIMSILEAFALPHQEYYSWQVKNAEGFSCIVRENGNGDFCLTDVAKVRIL